MPATRQPKPVMVEWTSDRSPWLLVTSNQTKASMLRAYLQQIFHVARRGDATEESYYSTLERLLRAFAESTGKRQVHITPLPKKTEAGNPDFRVWDGQQHIIGYIEAKKPTEDNLSQIQNSDQLNRYRHTFPNLILTNFFEFRLYRNGDLVDTVQIGRPFIVHRLKTIPPVEKTQEFFTLLEKFFAFSLPRSYTAKSLAIELAKRTRFLKDQVIAEQLKEESDRGSGSLLAFYEAFQKFLISTLTKEAFADLYAQTITYGLFAARTRAENGFTRRQAFDNIPPTIGILRDLFRFISLEDLPRQMEWIVDDIAEVLAVADVQQILHQRTGRDPIVHFYEPFLAEYDPKERERRGVYYTPEPVVSYIVKSLHQTLKDVFGRQDGFASTSVRVLDPAAGTCTFPAEAARLAMAEFTKKYGAGAQEGLIRDHLLKHVYAFELMMAPYAVGHLKIGFLLEELGHRLAKDERFQLYLTNTLEMEELQQTALPGIASLAEESHRAGKVKQQTPILVIFGNPPYSVSSANKSTFIETEMVAYKKAVRDERNLMPLSDDYVKFIRFAQWKIEQTGEGALGFITNHSYLDNPTFRGMRQSLIESFEQIYVLNLHGSSLKKERCPDGSKDENVFDIRQGVAIGLFIKKPGLKRKVCYAERWGLREAKHQWLEAHEIATTQWTTIRPKPRFYLFIPREEALLDQYHRYPRLTELFPINSTGVKTHRDHFVIEFDKDALIRRIRMFQDKNLPDDLIRQTFKLKDNRDWKLSEKRKAIIADEDCEEKVTQILHRPFDVRLIFYHKDAIDFGRPEVMRHMLAGENLGLISARSNKSSKMDHFLCTRFIMETKCGESTTQSCLFPLYLYSDTDKKDLFSHSGKPADRKPNLDPSLLQALEQAYGQDVTPEEIFSYVYAVLYAPTYRTKYAEFLKIDFPRVPFTRNHELFEKAADLGRRLVDLHLLRSSELDQPIARFQGRGDNSVEKPRYNSSEHRVYINGDQYFEGVAQPVWQYQIGGYQALDKWLKDRKGRKLNLEEIRHYCHVVTALVKTIEVQSEVDALYPEVEKNLIVIESAPNA